MPDYKQCSSDLVSTLMNEVTSPQTGYVLAPNGKYYGLTDSNIPYLGDIDYLRYWILQDPNMSVLFTSGSTTSEDTVKTWFSNNMTTTYKFMAALQFCATYNLSTLTAGKQFTLATISGKWQAAFTNGGSNPTTAPPASPTCS